MCLQLMYSVKRFIRCLPSIFFALAVATLVGITLLQIAATNTHRRIVHYDQRQEAVASATTPAAKPPIPQPHPEKRSPNPPPPKQVVLTSSTKRQGANTSSGRKKPETVRLEAVFDSSAPPVEANALIMRGYVNSARVRWILKTMSLLQENGRTTDGWKKTKLDSGDWGRTLVDRVSRSSGNVSLSRTADLKARAFPSGHLHQRKPLCPAIPKGLRGQAPVDMSPHQESILLRIKPGVHPGGSWSPPNCTSRHRVAIIIPYRDRQEHLAILLYHLIPILQRQLLQYSVYVVEQYGNDTFNKGVLMNAGVREALKENDFHCFVFHDVDMIPEDDRNMYSCPPMPRHMSVAVDKFNYTLPYTQLVGGVFSIRTTHFLRVNGYSNLYWGWGGEDDDMASRLAHFQMNIIRPPDSLARYSMIKHSHRPESPNNVRSALLRMAKKRAPRDGLNTVKYRLASKTVYPLYTHLVIDIGLNHRWQFVEGKRLIINF